MPTTNIYVIESQDSKEVVKALDSIFKVSSGADASTVVNKSPNDKVNCHMTRLEANAIDYYLSNNLHIKFKDLKTYMSSKFGQFDNAILSSYLRNQGYFPASVKLTNGSSTRYWIK